MCGIIAVLRRRSTRPVPAAAAIGAWLDTALAVDLVLDPEPLSTSL